MYNTGVIFVRMCNTAGAAGLMPQYYCSTASTANFTAVVLSCIREAKGTITRVIKFIRM